MATYTRETHPARSRTKKEGTKIYKARDIKKGIKRDPVLIEEFKVYVASSTKVPEVWAKMQGAGTNDGPWSKG